MTEKVCPKCQGKVIVIPYINPDTVEKEELYMHPDTVEPCDYRRFDGIEMNIVDSLSQAKFKELVLEEEEKKRGFWTKLWESISD